jgi:uncharacterized membrane protein
MSARRRLFIGLACGAAAAFVVAWFVPWQATVLIGWDVAALLALVRVLTQIRRYNADATRSHATRDDPTRYETELILLLAAAVSLVGVGFVFLKADERTNHQQVLLEALGIATIAISWLVVHTTYTLRYADIYYSADPPGGVDFKIPGRYEPDYHDFAYVAFTVGMTYQVSDTDIQSRTMRRAVLRHALLSFLFGAVILAAAVNVIAGLLNR